MSAAERSAKRKKIMITEHRCTCCGSNLPSEYTFRECESCRKRHNEQKKTRNIDKEKQSDAKKRYREKLISEKRCTRCRVKLPENYAFRDCENCRNLKNNQAKKKYKISHPAKEKLPAQTKEERNLNRKKDKLFLKQMHLCVTCKKKDAYTMAGRTCCAECARKIADRQRQRKKANPEKMAEIEKNHIEKYKMEHKCIQCGRILPADYENVNCEICLKKATARRRDKRIQNGMNWPRGNNGICFQCNKNLAKEGSSLCQNCYDKKIDIVNMMNERNRLRKQQMMEAHT